MRKTLTVALAAILTLSTSCGSGGTAPQPPLDCPTAIIQVVGGTVVAPATEVQLDGSSGLPQGQTQIGFAWVVVSAPGVIPPPFTPGSDTPMTNLRLDVVGTYVIHLQLFTTAAHIVCSQDEVTLEVVPSTDLYVEVEWTTDGDPDPLDTGMDAGADLDLHLIHPSAVGIDIDGDGPPDGWFDATFDCSWQNAQPDWPPAGTSGNPHLTRDDPDGTGPEAIAFDPAESASYRIGVHCLDDHGFGPSDVRVRIYWNGLLVYESPFVTLEESDFWQIADVESPTGAVVTLDNGAGQLDIVPGVVAP